MLEGLLAIVGLEVTTEGIRTGTGAERWRERVPGFRSCNSEAAGATCNSSAKKNLYASFIATARIVRRAGSM